MTCVPAKVWCPWTWCIIIIAWISNERFPHDSMTHSPNPTMLKGHPLGIPAIVFSSDSRMLVSGGVDGTVRFWELATSRERLALQAHFGGVNCLALSPDGMILASGGFDNKVRLWNLTTGRASGVLPVQSVVVSAVAFSPDGKAVAVGGGSGHNGGKVWGEIQVWSLATRTRLWIKKKNRLIASLAFSPDGRSIVTGDDRGITLWESLTGQERIAVATGGDLVRSIGVLGKNRMLFFGGTYGTIGTWKTTSNKCEKSSMQHSGILRGLALAQDGKFLASVSEDMTMRVWDVTRRSKSVRIPLGNPGWAVAFSPNGTMLAAADSLGTVWLWDINKLLDRKNGQKAPPCRPEAEKGGRKRLPCRNRGGQ